MREEEVDTCGYATYLEMALKEVYKILKGVLLWITYTTFYSCCTCAY